MADPCGIEGCPRSVHPLATEDRTYLRRCALHEIASYNESELREWGEENAADMVAIADAQLAMERIVTAASGAAWDVIASG